MILNRVLNIKNKQMNDSKKRIPLSPLSANNTPKSKDSRKLWEESKPYTPESQVCSF